jgi:hypothetical protein
MKRWIFAAALAVGLTLATVGGAAAGNGNGNGNGAAASGAAPGSASTPGHSGDAPGQSGDAPGQAKQGDGPAATPAATPAPTSAQPAAQPASPGRERHSSSTTTGQPGVKPSSTTHHWAHTTVGAKPDVSKRYGNGTTAAQIAHGRGAPDSTVLTGPGNSQPHKVTACGKPTNRSGGVDVHAVKHYDSAGCSATQSLSQSSPTESHSSPTQHTTVAPVLSTKVTASSVHDVGGAVAAAAGVQPASPGGAQSVAASHAGAGRVLGAHAALGSQRHGVAGGGHGVLGAFARVGGTTLPFTGLALWPIALAAAALVAAGALIRRLGRVEAAR